MAIKSSLVTARASSTVKKYEVPANSKVSANSFTLNDKAKSYYSAITKNYDNLKTYFTKIGDLYSACASKALCGDDLKKAVNKISKNCKNQATYCGTRKKELVDYFKYAKLEKEYYVVLEKLNKVEKSNASSKSSTISSENVNQLVAGGVVNEKTESVVEVQQGSSSQAVPVVEEFSSSTPASSAFTENNASGLATIAQQMEAQAANEASKKMYVNGFAVNSLEEYHELLQKNSGTISSSQLMDAIKAADQGAVTKM